MIDEKNREIEREMITRYYAGDNEKESIIPILAGLLSYSDVGKLKPIIMELLHDDPLVDQITKIYSQGQSLWFALAN